MPLKFEFLILLTRPDLSEKPYEIIIGQIAIPIMNFKMNKNVLSKILLIIPRKASSEDISNGRTTISTGIAQSKPIITLPITFLLPFLPVKIDFKVTAILPNAEAAE